VFAVSQSLISELEAAARELDATLADSQHEIQQLRAELSSVRTQHELVTGDLQRQQLELAALKEEVLAVKSSKNDQSTATGMLQMERDAAVAHAQQLTNEFSQVRSAMILCAAMYYNHRLIVNNLVACCIGT